MIIPLFSLETEDLKLETFFKASDETHHPP
jgi:hypothetical protein